MYVMIVLPSLYSMMRETYMSISFSFTEMPFLSSQKLGEWCSLRYTSYIHMYMLYTQLCTYFYMPSLISCHVWYIHRYLVTINPTSEGTSMSNILSMCISVRDQNSLLKILGIMSKIIILLQCEQACCNSKVAQL